MKRRPEKTSKRDILELAVSMGSFEAWSIEESRKEAVKRRRKRAARRRSRKGSKKP